MGKDLKEEVQSSRENEFQQHSDANNSFQVTLVLNKFILKKGFSLKNKNGKMKEM